MGSFKKKKKGNVFSVWESSCEISSLALIIQAVETLALELLEVLWYGVCNENRSGGQGGSAHPAVVARRRLPGRL